MNKRKKIITYLGLILLFISLVQISLAACPSRTDAKMGIYYTLSNYTNCLYIEISPAGCALNSTYALLISNENCSNKIVYISGNNTKYLLTSKIDPNSEWTGGNLSYYIEDKTISQEIGEQWSREIFFENDPNNKIIINAKNYPIEEFTSIFNKKVNYCNTEKEYGFGTTEYFECLKINESLKQKSNLSIKVNDISEQEPKLSFFSKIVNWFKNVFS
jgi:hypothetical protein